LAVRKYGVPSLGGVLFTIAPVQNVEPPVEMTPTEFDLQGAQSSPSGADDVDVCRRRPLFAALVLHHPFRSTRRRRA
jgi:hypothetical protein